jgi:hypothetical protein
MLTVKLSSAPNPDLNQTYAPAPSQTVKISTLEEASALCRQYIDKWDLGSGNCTGGQVEEDGREIAQVSYNGRVWEGLNE